MRELLELTDWAKKQGTCELRKLLGDSLLGAACGGALVQEPAAQRHEGKT